MTNENYKIESVQQARLNGREVKLFKAFKLSAGDYVFCGQFSAPARTANKNLENFINA